MTRFATLIPAAALALMAVNCSPPPAAGPAPPAAAEPVDPRQALDDALRLASELKYDESLAAFERIQAQTPKAVSALDGLKFVVIYAEVGNAAKFEELTRALVDRYRKPATATDAERSVKGYIVSRWATDPALVAHAVEVTRFASERAAADGEGAYQGFFDTSRGVAEYRAGHFKDAARWLSTTLEHESLYVRSLALPFYAMTELALGNKLNATNMIRKSRATALYLPKPGSDEYLLQWTDTLIARKALAEAEAAFAKAGIK